MIRRYLEYIYYHWCLIETKKDNSTNTNGWSGMFLILAILFFIEFGLFCIIINLFHVESIMNNFTNSFSMKTRLLMIIFFVVPNLPFVFYYFARDKAFKVILDRYHNETIQEKNRGIRWAWLSLLFSFVLLILLIATAVNIGK